MKEKQKNNQQDNQSLLLKKVFGVGAITFLSRIFGLLREIVITSLLGTTLYSDAFYLAYAVPNLFRRFTAEGAMLTTFIPNFTKIYKEKGELRAKEFARNFFWTLFFLLLLFCVLFITAAPWIIGNFLAAGFEGLVLEQSIFLTRVMFFYILLISLTAIYQGILNYHSVFIPSAFSPVLLNIAIVVLGLFLGDSIQNAVLGLALGVLLGGVVQLSFSHIFIHKQGYKFWRKFTFKDETVRDVFRKMLPGFFSAGIYQINIVISYFIASSLYTGAITSLTLSNRLLELVLGVLVVSITTVLLPQLSSLIVKKNFIQAQKKLKTTLLLTSFITLPITVGLIFTGKDIIQILFLRGEFNQNSLELTFKALLFHAPGLFFISWNRILTASMHSMQFFKRTAYLAFGAMLVNAILCWYSAPLIGHAGIALSSSVSQAFLFLLNLFFLPKKLKSAFHLDFFFNFLKQLLPLALLILVLYWFSFWQTTNVYFHFFASLLISCLTYFISCYFIRVKELKKIFYLMK